MSRPARPVLQYSPTGELLARHDSCAKAAKSTGFAQSSIATALNYLEIYPVKGFVWRREGEPFVKPKTPHP